MDEALSPAVVEDGIADIDEGDTPLLLAPEQVSRLLQVSERTVRRLAAAGELSPPLRLGQLVRRHRLTLEQWLDRQARRCPLRQSDDPDIHRKH